MIDDKTWRVADDKTWGDTRKPTRQMVRCIGMTMNIHLEGEAEENKEPACGDQNNDDFRRENPKRSNRSDKERSLSIQ